MTTNSFHKVTLLPRDLALVDAIRAQLRIQTGVVLKRAGAVRAAINHYADQLDISRGDDGDDGDSDENKQAEAT